MRQTTKEAVEGLRNALPSVADAKKSIGALAGVQTALRDLTKFAHETIQQFHFQRNRAIAFFSGIAMPT
jgi:hypothetical protein